MSYVRETMSERDLIESLVYSTVKIVRDDGGSGTGFITRDTATDGRFIQLLITNKHVIKGAKAICLELHKHHDGKVAGSDSIPVNLSRVPIFYHPEDNIDLVAIAFTSIMNNLGAHKNPNDFYTTAVDLNFIAKNENFETVEDVLMIGYPVGLADSANNLPLIRRGITATPPASDFEGRPIGVVDIAAFPGSSGSPIFLHRSIWKMKSEDSFYDAKRLHYCKLLGVLYAGPCINSTGKSSPKEIPTSVNQAEMPTMINLGYYIKSDAIWDLISSIYNSVGFTITKTTKAKPDSRQLRGGNLCEL